VDLPKGITRHAGPDFSAVYKIMEEYGAPMARRIRTATSPSFSLI
jgi:hypothetical protein